jgi:hypothetical protein
LVGQPAQVLDLYLPLGADLTCWRGRVRTDPPYGRGLGSRAQLVGLPLE